MTDTSNLKRHQVHFTLDGRKLVADTDRMAAAAILRLGGLNPAGYDLKQVRPGHRDPIDYADTDEVAISNGDKFVSVRQTATVA
ncbi:hypothetical protein [Pseudonocardia broussonetiae]|uniref:Multi-ubiquitin domain-containing protein n=1 Tax=Pseudonocardia broussonetiae TaxID=2736640 RepID=A0A6M6JEM7_9PSEU|nr:hypothetical protein [Pseudonocardia broussonetiae]QJY45525.1 hypothetical protein HOP40_06670 [Pseudonocardia broussonetiae]